MSVKYLTISARLLTQALLYSQIKDQSWEFRSLCRSGPHNIITESFSLRLIFAAFLPYLFHFYRKVTTGRPQMWLTVCEKLSGRLIFLLILKLLFFTNYHSFGVFGGLGMLVLELLLIVLALGIDQFHFYVPNAIY